MPIGRDITFNRVQVDHSLHRNLLKDIVVHDENLLALGLILAIEVIDAQLGGEGRRRVQTLPVTLLNHVVNIIIDC